jgi:hypothetical protein
MITKQNKRCHATKKLGSGVPIKKQLIRLFLPNQSDHPATSSISENGFQPYDLFFGVLLFLPPIDRDKRVSFFSVYKLAQVGSEFSL